MIDLETLAASCATISSAVSRSAFPETAREYGYTREYLERAERRLLACVIGYCALDGELASIRDGGEGHDGFRVNPLDVHEVLLCARTSRLTRADARRSRAPSRATGS